jgi:hypothetical protein
MLKESNARMKKLSSGNYKQDDMDRLQREAEIQIKIGNMVIQAFAVNHKYNKTLRGLERMNFMDENTAIDLGLGDPETDKVKCPIQEKLVIRAECLEYSGKHYEDCKGCEIGRATKDKLLPEN